MIFKRNKPRRFQYEPRYYDPRTDNDRSHRIEPREQRLSRRISQPAGIRLVTMVLLLIIILIIVAGSR